MMKHVILVAVLFVLVIDPALSQNSKFLLIGPSLGLNRSWRTYDKPTSNFLTNPANGFEGGLNVFYKSKGKFGFLADLSFLQTKSSITTHDYYNAADIELDEFSKWLTIGNNILFFPMPKSKALPFFGMGLYMGYLAESRLYVRMTQTNNPDEQVTHNWNLDEFRTNTNYFFKMVSGITINQFDKHRIVLLVTYSKALRPLTDSPPETRLTFMREYVVPYSFGNVNILTAKLMMAL